MSNTWIHTIQAKLSRVTSGGRYIVEIDGLRFLAIMPVILQHLSERMLKYFPQEISASYEGEFIPYVISRGSIGVLLFFAISGFILALPFAKSFGQGKKPIPLGKYYSRRLTRIEPPYVFWMSIFALILLIKGIYSHQAIIGHYLSSIFYVHYLVYQEFSVINPVAWSLEIEIQFYILAPLLAKLIFAKIPDKRRPLLLGISILGWLVIMQVAGWNRTPLKFTLLGQLPYFLIGFWVADWYLKRPKGEKKFALVWDIIGILSFVIMLFTWSEELPQTVAFLTSTALLMMSAFRSNLVGKFLRISWVSIIGGICYTIYLTHLPLLELFLQFTKYLAVQGPYWQNLLIQGIVCIPVLLVLSSLFFLFTEKPFMQRNPFQQIWKRVTSVQLLSRE
ncbi:MAG: acyltransferase [Bacteroidota bacterium]